VISEKAKRGGGDRVNDFSLKTVFKRGKRRDWKGGKQEEKDRGSAV